eukprot:Gb_41813 [translate_table: standard]
MLSYVNFRKYYIILYMISIRSQALVMGAFSPQGDKGADPPDNTNATAHKNGNGNNDSLIGAIAIGVILGLVVLVAILCCCGCYYYGRRKVENKGPLRTQDQPLASDDYVEKFLEEYALDTPKRYSYAQLTRATSNFSHELGSGGFGTVFRGRLPNGLSVAVKVLLGNRKSEMQFMNEVGTVGRIHHIHLVRLLGFCSEGSKRALVYEYLVNGSLDNFIFRNKEKLSWEQLHAIALGTARGIAYLHNDCQNRIIHYDIKPANVLLDAKFSPKVADFGLAMLCSREDTHVSLSGARGTPGYTAPEVWKQNGSVPITDKCDVYSFGMLLLEMVGRRKNLDLDLNKGNALSKVYFPDWVCRQVEKGEIMNVIGADTTPDDEERAKTLTLVSLWCIQANPSERPPMSKVVQILEGNAELSNPPNPFTEKPSTSSSPSTSELSNLIRPLQTARNLRDNNGAVEITTEESSL